MRARAILFGVIAVLSVIVFKNCTPSTVCTTADGTGSVDISNPLGSWKKISGYSTPRTAAELELNFDVLIVEAGNRVCVVRVVNGVSMETIYLANYTLDLNTKRISIAYTDNTSDEARYSITGGCSSTGMSLSYSDGTFETYSLKSKNLSEISCGSLE